MELQPAVSLPTHQTFRDAGTGDLVAIREIKWEGSSFTVVDPPDLPLGRYTVSLTDVEGNAMPFSWS